MNALTKRILREKVYFYIQCEQEVLKKIYFFVTGKLHQYAFRFYSVNVKHYKSTCAYLNILKYCFRWLYLCKNIEPATRNTSFFTSVCISDQCLFIVVE